MKRSSPGSRLFILGGLVALVSACGTLPQTPVAAAHANRGGSWMTPGSSSGDLLYIADASSNEVDVYSYPVGKRVGTLTGFEGLAFLCADSSGDVFVPNYGKSEILEYAHGGSTPIATLSDPHSTPYSCSFDSKTGNLAVANYTTTYGYGDIAIYENVSGNREVYIDYDVSYLEFCAYDASGNLFVEGFDKTNSGNFLGLDELLKGAKLLTHITLDDIPAFPTGLQWDGKYLAMGTGTVAGPSSGDTYVYHVQITRATGKTIGTTHLVERGPTSNFFIDGSAIIVTGGKPRTRTEVFAYPNGGKPELMLTEKAPAGVVVSNGGSK
ncbi:MAG TPA: hypothetical protein VKR56_13055 [Candidatus Cybelea sp.]|nr:hypothetical protein [Candidatus Cybelea sp.]